MEDKIIICECSSAEHQMVLRFEDDEDLGRMVYVEIHLMPLRWYERLWQGLKYIFGYKCCYGDFEEMILSPRHARQVYDLYRFLNKPNLKRHVNVEYGVVHLAHDALAAGEDRRVVAEEVEPQVDVFPLRRLVADIAEEDKFLLTFEFYEMPQHMALVNAQATVGRANVDEEPVGGIAAQRVVDETLDSLGIMGKGQADGRQPFPVAVMTHHQCHCASFAKGLLHLLAAAEFKVSQQLRVAHAEQFERLEEIVAQPVVETPLYLFHIRQ